MEWGNFWSSHLPRTTYDIDLDADSPNPNDQVKFYLLFCCLVVKLKSYIVREFDAGF